MPDAPMESPAPAPAITSTPAGSPAPRVLVLHGLGGGPYEVQPVIDALQAAGCRVVAPTLPGHEAAHGATMPGSDWRDWLAASEAALDALRAEGGPASAAPGVVGFSTGGTLALLLAARRPEAVGRLALLAPFLAIRFSRWLPVPARVWLGPVARVVPSLPRRGPAARDRQVRRNLAGASRFRTFSLVATQSALHLIEQVRPTLKAVRCPTLILQGRRDSVVEPRRAPWLRDRLGATDKRLVILPRSDHLLAWDHDRLAVASAVVDFLGRPEIAAGRHESAEPPSSLVTYIP